MERKRSTGGMGHLDAEEMNAPIIRGPMSHKHAIEHERWGKTLCKVTLAGDLNAEFSKNKREWNLAITDTTICLYHDDCENCKLIPRRNIQMIDLVDTDITMVEQACVQSCLPWPSAGHTRPLANRWTGEASRSLQ